jgi:hypothetical protein
MKKNTELVLIGLSLLLYVLSLSFNALGCKSFGVDSGYSGYKVESGINLLLMGWMGVATYNFGWLANINYLITLISIVRKSNKVFFLACLNVTLALSSLTLFLNKSEHVTLYSGYYLWVASFLVLVIYGSIRSKYSKNTC